MYFYSITREMDFGPGLLNTIRLFRYSKLRVTQALGTLFFHPTAEMYFEIKKIILEKIVRVSSRVRSDARRGNKVVRRWND